MNNNVSLQVNNAIVRKVLQGCSALRQLYLDGCRHVTDAGFHLQQSPFYVLLGAVSLETISVQGCPQVPIIRYVGSSMCRYHISKFRHDIRH